MHDALFLKELIALCLLQAGAVRAEPNNPDHYRLTDPVVHGNMAIYFVRGASRGGPVPLTLQEAMARNVIKVIETNQVNEVQVENTGDEEIFIQSGDIVKGGQQDRVLSVSVVLPPHSGALPITSFCVESGRWSTRGNEDARRFSSASAALPSRKAKLELARAVAPKPNGVSASIGSRQQEIWKNVAQIQNKLSSTLKISVAAPRSQTSLQLSLENDDLAREQAEYVAALQPRGEQDGDIVGYVFAINGKVNSADIYRSNGLFRKMWPKLLRAGITEAITERDAVNNPAPPRADVSVFMSAAESARAIETKAGEQTHLRMRDSEKVMLLEARPAAAPEVNWIHRSYLAK